MRQFRYLAAVAALQLAWAAHAQAQTLNVSGDPGPLAITTATAGLPPDPVSDNQTTYNVSASLPLTRITGRVDASLPSGITLMVTLQAPSGASSAGAVALDATERDLVTGIPEGSFSGLSITYRLSATSAAGVIAPSTRSVTLRVTSGL